MKAGDRFRGSRSPVNSKAETKLRSAEIKDNFHLARRAERVTGDGGLERKVK